MAAHDLEDERPRVRVRGRVDVVDGLANPVERGRRADGEVRHGHVVVDRADEPDDLEVRVLARLLLRDAALALELRDEPGPLRAEDVRAGERAVAAAHDERVDALLDHVVRRGEPALARAERRRARGADQRASLNSGWGRARAKGGLR